MFAELMNRFHNSEYGKRVPTVTPAIILSGIGACAALRSRRHDLKAILHSPLAFLRDSLLEKDTVPVIPSQEKEKPVILFDINNFLSCDRFSLSRFDVTTLKRAYTEEFLFNTAHYYEIISVSDIYQPEGLKILDRIDPFGCISYRIFVKDKKAFKKENLNRPLSRLAVVSSMESEFHPDFDRNIIRLEKWSGANDSVLLDMVHFFTNLHYMNLRDYRATIESYQGSDFCTGFKGVLRRLFRHRNLFSQWQFGQKLEEVNEKKIKDYEAAKSTLLKLKARDGNIRAQVLRFLRDLILS